MEHTPIPPSQYSTIVADLEKHKMDCIHEKRRLEELYNSQYKPRIKPYQELSKSGRKYRRYRIRQLEKILVEKEREQIAVCVSTGGSTLPEAQVITEQQPQKNPSEEA